MDGIDWRIVQRMIMDFPSVDYEKKDGEPATEKKTGKIPLTPQTANQFFGELKKHSK